MAKSKRSNKTPSMPMPTPGDPNKDYQLQDDANLIDRHAELMADKPRHARAMKHSAKRHAAKGAGIAAMLAKLQGPQAAPEPDGDEGAM